MIVPQDHVNNSAVPAMTLAYPTVSRYDQICSMIDEPSPMQPMRRVRYYLGSAADALDSTTTALQATPAIAGRERKPKIAGKLGRKRKPRKVG